MSLRISERERVHCKKAGAHIIFGTSHDLLPNPQWLSNTCLGYATPIALPYPYSQTRSIRETTDGPSRRPSRPMIRHILSVLHPSMTKSWDESLVVNWFLEWTEPMKIRAIRRRREVVCPLLINLVTMAWPRIFYAISGGFEHIYLVRVLWQEWLMWERIDGLFCDPSGLSRDCVVDVHGGWDSLLAKDCSTYLFFIWWDSMLRIGYSFLPSI